MKSTLNAANKSTLKLVAKPLDDSSVRAGGLAPSGEMDAGQYVATCEGSKVDPKFGKESHKLLWRVMEGAYAGTALFQWVTIERFGNVTSLNTPYGRQCLIALSDEVEPGDSLNPDHVFRGKTFLVQVGWRKTKGRGGQADDKLALTRKDASDFLRVHQVLELVEMDR